MLVFTFSAMNWMTSSGIRIFSFSTFFRRMAIRVSMSGGWMSVTSPHSKREARRSSRLGISFGGRSLVTTICLFALWSALKVWKNSSCVLSLPARNWMSSMRRMSMLR